MAPPVFLIDPALEPDEHHRATLTGAEARHASQVMRLRVGEEINLVDGEGRRLEGVVHSISRDALEISVERVVLEPEPRPRIVVVQALAKGDRGEQAVAAMTEVGVDVIVPWSAEHCVTRWVGDRAQRGVDKWRATARTSAKQSRRSRIPRVESVHSTDDLAPLMGESALAVCLDESASAAVSDLLIPESGDIVLVVGPEGGLSDSERARLVDLGAQRARLGPSVLRTSTAGPVAAAVILSRTSRWTPS